EVVVHGHLRAGHADVLLAVAARLALHELSVRIVGDAADAGGAAGPVVALGVGAGAVARLQALHARGCGAAAVAAAAVAHVAGRARRLGRVRGDRAAAEV